MRITIVGSSSARVEKLKIRDRLRELGHEAIMNPYYERLVNGMEPELAEMIDKEHAKAKRKYGFIKWYYEQIVQSDAILVVNLPKNNIENYIGGNTLMEIGFAHVHDKKVFLLNPAPTEVPYTDEINAMFDEIINGDLTKIC
jgi:nucleoside 2-deoxyribosyltransferase